MTKVNVLMIDRGLRSLIWFNKGIFILLDIVGWVLKRVVNILVAWFILMVLNKMMIIDIFDKYYFKEVFSGIIVCYVALGLGYLFSEKLKDEWLFKLECFNEEVLRKVIGNWRK
ncbi:MAG: hypothetical protein MR210_00610 [Erysipelotrichaceae bacterium]|nr:hypothetical protein [Erysipelotrichaceae bacterium]MDY5252065.1 hypothetical protein [Erysipelotrichaceae bacterium]